MLKYIYMKRQKVSSIFQMKDTFSQIRKVSSIFQMKDTFSQIRKVSSIFQMEDTFSLSLVRFTRDFSISFQSGKY